jgi:hypothetical protein
VVCRQYRRFESCRGHHLTSANVTPRNIRATTGRGEAPTNHANTGSWPATLLHAEGALAGLSWHDARQVAAEVIRGRVLARARCARHGGPVWPGSPLSGAHFEPETSPLRIVDACIEPSSAEKVAKLFGRGWYQVEQFTTVLGEENPL